MVKLSIVILSYNTKNLTLNCLKSILDRYKDSSSFEIIVVDNNSTDGSPQVVDNLKTKISNLKLIKNKANFGFSKGNNIGVKEAKGSYILFLNSDTEIKDLGFFDMVSFLESNPNIGILGGKLLNTDGSIQPSSGKFYNLFNVIITLLGGERLGFVRKTPEKIEQIDWVSGACMMVKKDIFLK
jgi:GT2 family glycosyltransferase